jgi:hypothetical protein
MMDITSLVAIFPLLKLVFVFAGRSVLRTHLCHLLVFRLLGGGRHARTSAATTVGTLLLQRSAIRPISPVELQAAGEVPGGLEHHALKWILFGCTVPLSLMAGLDPAIQLFSADILWMAGSGAGHEGIEGPDTMRTYRRQPQLIML